MWRLRNSSGCSIWMRKGGLVQKSVSQKVRRLKWCQTWRPVVGCGDDDLLFKIDSVVVCQGTRDKPICVGVTEGRNQKKKNTLLESSSSGAKPQRSHLGYYNELMKSPLEETLSLVMHVYHTFVYLCVRWYLVKHFIHCVLHLKH